MPSTCHYPGNVVDDLIWMAEQGHLWGPDSCGTRRLGWDDVAGAFRLGGASFTRPMVQLAEGEVCPRGAMYELHDAQYNPVTNQTTAWFTPKVNPLQNVRYHGGKEDPDRQPVVKTGASRLARQDKVRAR